MNSFCQDRDILGIEPVIFIGGGFPSQQISSGSDGVMAGTTFTSAGSNFIADGIAAGMVLCTHIAVEPDERDTNLADFLPSEISNLNWVHSENVVREISHPAGTKFEMLTDRATGQLDTEPVISREVWPAWINRWGLGEDEFALGSFGYGGSTAPGLGRGAFGAGVFGINTDTIELTAVLAETGTHQVAVRTATPDNQYATATTKQIAATPPPAPPSGIAVTNYNHSTGTLTLQIQ